MGRTLTIIFFMVCLGAPGSDGQAFTIAQSNSGISRPDYHQLVQSLRVTARRHDEVDLMAIGPGDGLDLYVVRIARRWRLTQRSSGPTPAVVLTGGLHGSEYMNLVDRFPEILAGRIPLAGPLGAFLNHGFVYLIPVLNPRGFIDGDRGNGVVADLNRDFGYLGSLLPRFSQPETRSIRDFFLQEQKEFGLNFQVALDYHCCKGALLFPMGLAEKALESHRMIAKLMQQNVDQTYSFGSTEQILGYAANGTLKDFWYRTFQSLSFTFEGTELREPDNLDGHVSWLESIFAYISAKGPHYLSKSISE